ncbi:HNH endonuclease [bacterium]|nr:HNH endonuclease [bacterium]
MKRKLLLDELKEKLNNYQPLFDNTDKRRSISPSFNYQENDLEGEIWKTFPLDKDYTVSSLGRIKYKGKIQKQKDEKIQYVTLEDKNLRQDYVYNFVAYTFLGKMEDDGMHVHHITNDGYYNTIDNLVLLTKDEHSYVHGFEIGAK